ncbi:MAG TPA: DUF1570 domain-containing protein [Lacipirellulaceae bacterium]|nr:DUF1570 domain-containing protein [Lacipirellulaceae bacterium]
MHRPPCVPLALALALAGAAASVAAEPAPFMMRALVGERLVEGQPLSWSDDRVLLLGRDGALLEFDPAAAKHSKKIARQFVPYTSAEMQALLQGELGGRFTASASTHFVVAHPRGVGSQWAERLEALYRGFTHYMSVRGFPVQPPPAPLAAVVFATQEDYYAHAAAAGTPLPAGTLGHYDAQSNRIYLYDLRQGDPSADWSANAETIIHEATHQTAYNVGVHARFTEQPRWLVEGLAMMFEAPGVWNATSIQTQGDRLNMYRLGYFRAAAAKRPANWIAQLVASDRPFETTTLDAYAAAWALSFYLCETRPQEYSGYLARVAARPRFSAYPPETRLRDFARAFGSDFELLAAHLARYVEGLP